MEERVWESGNARRENKLERSEPRLDPALGPGRADENPCRPKKGVPPGDDCGLGALGVKLGARAAGGLAEGCDGVLKENDRLEPTDGLEGTAGAGRAGLNEGLGRLGLIDGAGELGGLENDLGMPDKRFELPNAEEPDGARGVGLGLLGIGLLRAAIRPARDEPPT